MNTVRNFTFLDPTPLPPVTKSFPPSVTISKSYFHLRKSMLERIGHPKFIKLAHDIENNMLAILPCGEIDPMKIQIIYNNKTGGGRFPYRKVFEKYKLPIPENQITRDAVFEENYIIFSVLDITVKKPTL